jgi:polyhydroxyalkanoate synthase
MQAYLSVGETAHGLIDESGLEWDSEERLRFVADNLIDALAPTNFPWLNPAAIKVTVDRGGRNLVTGARQLVRDARSPARIPANVDRSGFRVGENLATSPGGVVRREPMFELIQYTPKTGDVREIPLVVVPPMISKYYVVDLSPGRSLVEYLVAHGQQVLTLSWRQPGPENGDWDLDAYVGAIVEALETAREVSGAEQVHVLGLCAGGVATACAAAHLAATGRQDTLAGVTLAVTVLDNHRAGTVSSFISPDTAAAAVERVRRKGYLDKAELARTFAWLRPNDMIWNYWVNNYLLGNRPPAFDLLYWNSDSMHMAAGLHRDFVRVGVENPLAQPGLLSVLGTPVDLSAVSSDAYVIAGETDHITPWQNCYRTTGLLGGRVRFVLSTSGHIAAVINPPGNPRASYRVADHNPADAVTWLEGAVKLQGTWWDDWAAWLEQRSGATAPARQRLGSRRHPVIEAAPGSYVLND